MIDKMILEIGKSFLADDARRDFPEVLEADGRITDFIYNDNGGKVEKVQDELADLIGLAEIAFEKQGFYYGFKYAYELFGKEASLL